MAMAEVIHLPEQPRTVQVEDGYTRVAHGILETLALADLSKRHYKVLLVMIRQTYGYNKKSDEVSLSQFEAKTGVLKPNVSTAIDELLAMGVLMRTPGKHAACLSINKAYAQWTGKAKVDLSKVCGYQNNNPRVIETMEEGYQNDNSEVIESITTKDNSKRKDQKTTPKENLSRSLRERFEIFWGEYPKKKSKITAEKAFAKRNPDEQLFNDLMAGLERAMTSEQWQDPKYIPHAGTWLNAGGWMDEIQTEYTDAERAVIQAFNEALGEQIGTVDEAVFVESRAGAIRAFLGARPADPDFWKRYFPAVREKVDIPPHAGLDWLISPKGFSDVIGRMNVKRNPDGTKASGEWHKSASGITAKAKEMGIAYRDDEPIPAIAARVRAAIEKLEIKA
ncbi:phage replication protein O [Paraburkholderia sp. BL8N3]|nr:replication protein [Paraburkholderia sp. BL8N3]TCK39672.1 phage replication protein O [Paraburkholderia sp. BL8N3]